MKEPSDFLPAFAIPDSPDSPIYREVLEEIERASQDEADALFRTWCEEDYWFFLRYCSSFGEYMCGDVHLPKWYGRPWADHPWIFDRCRDIQLDPFDSPTMRKWPRYYFKSQIITVEHTIWDNAIHSDESGSWVNTLILTYKTDVVGEGFLSRIKQQCERNRKLSYYWPHCFYRNPEAQKDGSPLWTSSRLKFKQRGSPGEPSVMVASVNNMPTSGHFQRIKMDDVVVRETVQSPDQSEKAFIAMQQTAPLRSDHTLFFYVGTNWAPGDPWEMAEKKGMFKVDHQDCYGPPDKPLRERTEPVLRSAEWLDSIRRDMRPEDFAAQMRGVPESESSVNFERNWLNWYYTDPYEERQRGNIYVLVDTSKSASGASDYITLVVVKYGEDGNKYLLDAYRDRFTTKELKALLFVLAGDQDPELRHPWMGRGAWNSGSGNGKLKVFMEQFGAQRDIDYIKDEMESRSFRALDIRQLPSLQYKDAKLIRIQRFGQECQAGKWYFPHTHRVGHTPKGDKRDVLEVFLAEEYDRWTPRLGAEHDDMLDILGYTATDEFGKIARFPRSASDDAAALVLGQKTIKSSRPPGVSVWAM